MQLRFSSGFKGQDSDIYIKFSQKKILRESYKEGEIFFKGDLSEKVFESELNVYNKYDTDAKKKKDKTVFWMHLSEFRKCKGKGKGNDALLLQKMKQRYELYYEEEISLTDVSKYIDSYVINQNTVWFFREGDLAA